MSWGRFSQNATAVEYVLVALNHMQVSVCYQWSRDSFRKRHRGTPGLKKSIIPFPQHIADLKILAHFFSSLGENDVVDVRVRAGDADDDEGRATALRGGHCARFLKASWNSFTHVWRRLKTSCRRLRGQDEPR